MVDEAQLFWDKRLGLTLDALCEGARKAAPVRILVVNPMEPSLEPPRIDRVITAQAPTLRLEALDAESADGLWRSVTQSRPELALIENDAAGMPLAIIRTAHGALENRPPSYWLELTRHVLEMMPELADGGGLPAAQADRSKLKLVAFAALAGPTDRKAVLSALGDVGRYDLRRVLPDSDLDHGLPSISPEDERLELMLRCLAVLGEEGMDTAKAAMAVNPAATEVALLAAWATRPEVGLAMQLNAGRRLDLSNPQAERASILLRVQHALDAALPDRPARLIEQAQSLAYELAVEGLADLDVEQIEPRLIDLIDRRPFDPNVRLAEARAAFNAITHYARAGRWAGLERWGDRLLALVRTEPFDQDPAIRLEEALAAVNAILHYGGAGRWDDLERWGDRLLALARTEPFDQDPAIRLEEAKAAVNAINAYGGAGRWDDLERWGDRLLALARTEPFDQDPAIRLAEAMAAVNAINAYGHGSANLALRHQWFVRLARCARWFPTEAEIQQWARDCGVSPIEQEKRGWPYGRDRGPRTLSRSSK